MKHITRLWPYAPYIALSLLVLAPLLSPGFVLTMDMVFTPVLRLSRHVDNTWLLYALLHTLDVVLPADVVQKLLLFAILLLSGIGMHRLLLAVRPHARYWPWGVYAGGVLYTVNPFVYDRLMAGQWGVLLGYALLPWFAASLLAFWRAPGWRATFCLAGWAVVMSIVSIHSLGYIAVLAVVALAVSGRDWPRLKQMLRYGAVAVAIFAVASAYWLLPTVMGQGRIAASLQTFTVQGQAAFATVDSIGTGEIGAVLGLLGFWQEDRNLYVQPIESYALWGFVYVAFLGLMVVGAVQAWKRQRLIAATAMVIGVASLILALYGGWLASHVPLLAGYREPQKFVALLALVYGYFAAWGVAWTMERVSRGRPQAAYAAFGGIIVLLLLYTPTLLWGAQGQLRTTRYPDDWFAANRLLNAEPAGGKVLILPWHLYMSYSFTEGRIIANPAKAFFDREVVSSDDPELPGVAPQTPDAQREAVQQDILPAGARGEPIAPLLRDVGIEYVLLNKDLEWADYEYVGKNAELLYDGQTLRLYRLPK